jgi:hypothetical protein
LGLAHCIEEKFQEEMMLGIEKATGLVHCIRVKDRYYRWLSFASQYPINFMISFSIISLKSSEIFIGTASILRYKHMADSKRKEYSEISNW